MCIASRAGETSLRAQITERMQPGVVYTTFHHPGLRRQRGHHRLLRLGDQLPGIQGDRGAGRAVNARSDWQERIRQAQGASRQDRGRPPDGGGMTIAVLGAARSPAGR